MRVHVYIRATKCTIIYHHQTVLKQTNKQLKTFQILIPIKSEK